MNTLLDLLDIEYSEAARKIESFIAGKLRSSGLCGVILGLSGGLDSSVTAHLLVRAVGADRVFGLIMPDGRITSKADVEDAEAVAGSLGIRYKIIDIAGVHKVFLEGLEPDRLAEGNLRARIRMCLLYYHANLMKMLISGTGDRSEILIGYFTKYGDGGADFMPIGGLFKTQVRELGRRIGVPHRILDRKSSPALWPGHIAEDEIGISYDVIDQILYLVFGRGLGWSEVAVKAGVSSDYVERIRRMYEQSGHKRVPPEVCVIR